MKKQNTVEKVLVVGAGNIGGAMARGLAASGTEVVLYNRSAGRLAAYEGTPGITLLTTSLAEAASAAPAFVLVCVEGCAMEAVVRGLVPLVKKCRPVVGSCAATPTLDNIADWLGAAAKGTPLVRVLPNIAATVGRGVNLMASRGLDDTALAKIEAMLAPTGVCVPVDESLFGAAMSLSSCGLAYAFRYVRACTEAAVQLGISPAVAVRLTAATLGGAAAMLADGAHPEVLVDSVTTPGGLTVKGLNAMEKAGFSAAVMAGITASTPVKP